MDQDTIQAQLAALPNLAEFARDHKLPLRTLVRIKTGGQRANAGTLMLIDAALNPRPPAPPEPPVPSLFKKRGPRKPKAGS